MTNPLARTATHMMAAVAGFTLGLAPVATADIAFTPHQIYRACTTRTDTNCVLGGISGSTEPRRVRYADNGAFCVLDNLAETTRCELFWPFVRPVINAHLGDSFEPAG